MADKLKGALFNSLMSLGIEPERILDLYAGTGSVGIEALSRGGVWADFVDQGRDQTNVIRANLQSTGFASRAAVHKSSVKGFVVSATRAYDFIVVDPPYADPTILETLESIASSQLVESGTIVAIGHWPRITLPDRIGRMDCLRHRCHGDSCFSIYEVNDQDRSDPAPEQGRRSDS
jgi:16S rRNA (guanine966-N2)-methyltransferase